ncbi:MAG: response regulator [Pseudomonadota bacterium]
MKKQCILFVDDEHNILMGFKRSLRHMRKTWEMLFANSAQEALDIMQQTAINIIVSDMLMPDMDGYQLLKVVSKQYPATIRIILSGQTSRGSYQRAIFTAHQVLSKPCATDILIHTLEKSVKLSRILSNKDVKNTINKIVSLPALPDIYTKLINELESKTASVKTVANIVVQDFAISTKVLQLVNSAFFGLSVKVSSIEYAVQLLGIETINSLVLETSIFSTIDKEIFNRFKLQEVWEHSLFSASVVRKIIKQEKITKDTAEKAILVSLLHHVGKLVLASQMTDEYYPVFLNANNKDGLALLQAEKQAFGYTHTDIGAYLLGIWGFPLEVVEAVAFIDLRYFEETIPTSLSATMDCRLLAYISNLLSHNHNNSTESSFYHQELLHLKALNHPLLSSDKLQSWQKMLLDDEKKS